MACRSLQDKPRASPGRSGAGAAWRRGILFVSRDRSRLRRAALPRQPVNIYPRRLWRLFGTAAANGDMLHGYADDVAKRDEVTFSEPRNLGLDQPIRVVLGPQDDYFTARGDRGFFSRQLQHCAGIGPDGVPPRRTAACTPKRLQHRLGWHRRRVDPGARLKASDRAAGGRADHRRLSEDCHCDFSRLAGARAFAAPAAMSDFSRCRARRPRRFGRPSING